MNFTLDVIVAVRLPDDLVHDVKAYPDLAVAVTVAGVDLLIVTVLLLIVTVVPYGTLVTDPLLTVPLVVLLDSNDTVNVCVAYTA